MRIIILTVIATCFLAFNACKKDEPAQKPTVTTESVAAITANSVTVVGIVKSEGGSTVYDRGFYVGTSSNPETSGEKIRIGSGYDSFSSELLDLTPNTTYYIKAYATNKVGTGIGNLQTFKTQEGLPVLTTTATTSISFCSATSGGVVSSDAGFSITKCGVVWNTLQNPTIDNKQGITQDGWDIGTFASSLSNLTPNTTYYVRAYATNSNGTGYGNQQIFKSSIVVMNITTTIATSISSSTAISGGNISSENAIPVIIGRGVVWSTSQNPTLENNEGKTSENTELWHFVSNLTALKANTNYYVRAYATNNYGTQYGNQISFTTMNSVVDIDGNIYNTVVIGTQTWMVENLKTTKYRNGDNIPNITDNTSWNSQSTGAYCWYNNNFANKNPYGALYNYYTVVDSRNLCPSGWHIPTKDEWNKLITYLGGEDYAGYRMSTIEFPYAEHNESENRNSSGFTALLGGLRFDNNGTFTNINYVTGWWSSTSYSVSEAYYQSLIYNFGWAYMLSDPKVVGASVRCIKD